MRKKLFLLLASLSILLVAVYVYQRYLGSDFVPPVEYESAEQLDMEIEPGSLGSVPIGQTNKAQWMAVSDPDTGRRQAVFQAQSWSERDGRQVLESPQIEIYPSRGGKLEITGDQASLVVDDIGSSVAPRQGTLSGNVRIIMDISDSPRASADARHVEIHMETMDFDNELQEIRSPGEITVITDEFTLSGTELLLQWNNAPDELRVLRLSRDGKLVYNGKSGDKNISSSAEQPPADSISSVPADSFAANPVYTETGGQPVGSAEKTPQGYILTINDDVNLESARQNISDAQQVQIVASLGFDGDFNVKKTSSGSGDSAGPKADSSAGSGNANSAGLTDTVSDDITVTWRGAAMLRPWRKKDTDIKLPGAGNFTISASGDNMQISRDEIIADCSRVRYFSKDRRLMLSGTDGDMARVSMVGGSVLNSEIIDLNDSAQLVRAVGPGEIHLSNADLEQYSRGNAEAVSNASISWKKSVELHYENFRTPNGKTVRRPVMCEFAGSVALDSDTLSVDSDTMRLDMIAARGATDSGDFSKVAADKITASGNVKLTRNIAGKEDMTEQVDSDSLTVQFGSDDTGRTYPLYIHAIGKVKASQQTRSIAADDILLKFSPREKTSDKTDGQRFVATYMTAAGSVILSGSEDGNDSGNNAEGKKNALVSDGNNKYSRTINAYGSRLESDLLAGRHELYGYSDSRPAQMVIDHRDKIFGDPLVINFNSAEGDAEAASNSQSLESAHIDGSGRAVFMLDKGIDGKLLPRPRPAVIRWARRMAYHSGNDSIIFLGDVSLDSFDGLDIESEQPIRFDSPGDHLRSEIMTVVLADLTDADQARKAGRNIVRTITAKGKAKMLRRWHDEDGFMRDRSQLSGPSIVLDQLAGEFIVLGEGSLLVEDYRKPAEDTSSQQAGLESPSQTLFRWTDAMTVVHMYDSTDENADASVAASWTAFLDGDVAMRHRSGSHIIRDDSLHVRNDYTMPAGTVRQLDCDKMLVQFVQNDDAGKGGDDSPKVELSLFEALGSVYMVDGDFEAQGGRVIYDMDYGRALITGDDGSGQPTNARVFRRGGPSGDIETISPRIMLKRVGSSYQVQAIDTIGRGRR